MKICSREKKDIFVLADSEERIQAIKSAVETIQKDLNYAGTYILTDIEDAENAVNEINSVAPDVILSVVKTPLHEEFIDSQKMKINSRLLVAMSPAMRKVKEDGTIDNKGILNRIRAKFFNSAAKKYSKRKNNLS